MGYAEALEQQAATRRLLEVAWENLTADERQLADAEVTLDILRHGDAFAVSRDIAGLLLRGATTLPDVSWSPELFPVRGGWCYLDEPIPLAGFLRGTPPAGTLAPRDAGLRALAWNASAAYFFVALFATPSTHPAYPDVPDCFTSGGFGWGRLEDGDMSGPLAGAQELGLGFLYTLCQFVRQRILTVAARPVQNRHARKRLAKELGHDPLVHVVELRRREYQQRHESESREVEYSCQWLVRGHWRQHFYPASGERRPLWIAPHVQGPGDKPLRVAAQTAYAVVR